MKLDYAPRWMMSRRDGGVGGLVEARDAGSESPVLKVEEIQGPALDWDEFVAAQPSGDIVQSTMWGLAKREIGRTPLLLTARRLGGELLGGALLIESRVPTGLRIGYVAHGPVVAESNGGSMRHLLRALVGCARERKISALIVQMPEGGSEQDNVLDELGFAASCVAVAPEATIRIDVTESDESILSRMSAMRLRNLRRPVDAMLDISESDEVRTFHELHCATARRSGFAPLSLPYLQAQWRALAPSGQVSILLARYHGRPVAGVWLSRFGKVVTFRLAGWDADAGAPKNVNERLHWAAIRWARDRTAHSYDFGGFDRTSAELFLQGKALPAGFDRTHNFFKLGFGGTPILLPRARYLLLNRAAHAAAQMFVPLLLHSGVVTRLAQKLRT